MFPHVSYLPMSQRAAVLADPHTLAVIEFSDQAATPPPLPAVQVALAPHGTPMLEVWRGTAPCTQHEEGGITLRSDGQWHWLALHEADTDTDAAPAAQRAYARLYGWLTRHRLHPLRIWNYIDGITEGDGDDERYRRFCVGRAGGIGRTLTPAELPAATAIGHAQPTGRLQVYALAAAQPGIALENPRQLAAWRYPRRYGPQAPGFARALLPDEAASPLLLSGTASVIGHASRHDHVLTQLEEVIANLRSLIGAARDTRPDLPADLGASSHLKCYVRDAASLPLIDDALRARLPAVPCLLLHGHVCRRELLVEIDGVHAPA